MLYARVGAPVRIDPLFLHWALFPAERPGEQALEELHMVASRVRSSVTVTVTAAELELEHFFSLQVVSRAHRLCTGSVLTGILPARSLALLVPTTRRKGAPVV